MFSFAYCCTADAINFPPAFPKTYVNLYAKDKKNFVNLIAPPVNLDEDASQDFKKDFNQNFFIFYLVDFNPYRFFDLYIHINMTI